jgi:mRNA interferase MazF
VRYFAVPAIHNKNPSEVQIIVKRGEVYFANLNPVVGSEQGGKRPVVIIQNDIGNTYSTTTIIAPITTNNRHSRLPTHVSISKKTEPLRDSVAMLEQIRTIEKSRLKKCIGTLSDETMKKIDDAVLISIGVKELHKKRG